MKKTLLSILSVITIGAFAQETNVVNRGFEDWITYDYEYPDSLSSTVDEYLRNGSEMLPAPIEKSTDAHEGSSSLKISCLVNNEGDTVNGYALIGGWGENGPEGGEPYTFQADSFTFHYKCDLQPLDTAWVILTLKKAGNSIGGGQFPITGTQNTWKEYTVVNPGAILAPDTIFFAAISTNAIEDDSNAKPGSWLKLDRLGMKKINGDFKAFPNGGFESWSDTSIVIVDEWFANPYTSSRTSTAHSGSYALELQVREQENGDNSIDTTPGFISNYNYDGDEQGTHFVNTVEALVAWVDYEPNGTDTGYINIEFLKNGISIEQHQQQITGATSGYEEVILPLDFPQAPDSFKIWIYAGENPGTILRVDDLDLTNTVTSSNEVGVNQFSMFPNPATNTITLNSTAATFKIHNIVGAEVKNEVLSNVSTTISVSDFNPGIYMVSIYNESNSLIETQQLVIK